MVMNARVSPASSEMGEITWWFDDVDYIWWPSVWREHYVEYALDLPAIYAKKAIELEYLAWVKDEMRKVECLILQRSQE